METAQLRCRRQRAADVRLGGGSLPTYSWTTGELEIAYYRCCAPTGTSDDELIRVAGARWPIEDCFQTAKTEVGLDHYQVRRYWDGPVRRSQLDRRGSLGAPILLQYH